MYLYETTAVVNTSGDTLPVRICDNVGYNRPTGPGYFAPVLSPDSTGARIKRGIYPNRLGFGLGEVDAGVITGIALSREWDWLQDAGFGREATLRLGATPSTAYPDFAVIATGVASAALVDTDVFRIGWRDKTATLNKPLSEGTFAGTNSGTTGLEGLPTDIAGQRKPRAWGDLLDIAPILVNAPLRCYAWNYDRAGNRAPSYAVSSARVRGSEWTFTGDYPNAAALAAASISVGYYATCLAESLLRMGGSTAIDGGVRIDVQIGSAANNYAAAVAKAVILDTGEDSGNIDDDSIDDLNTAYPYAIQFYTQEATAREVVDSALAAILAWGIVNRLGVYTFGTLPVAPTTADAICREFIPGVSAAVNDMNILSIKPILDGETKGVPAKSVRVRYNYRQDVQDIASLASGVSDERKAELSAQWATTAPVVNAGAATMFDNADEVTFDTILRSEAAADDVASRLGALLAVRRGRYAIDLRAELTQMDTVQPGKLLDVYCRGFGLSSGKQMIILETEHDTQARSVAAVAMVVG